ncbi:MAG TPA: FecR domain-containing protein [Candidatus Acidoferrum sp.]|jgi:hypothetical protein|nr:FecR domain-containing protein [Candidatus Acidoferrum sp.]
MKPIEHLSGVVAPLLISLVIRSAPPVYAQSQPAQALVHAVHGAATCLVGGSWQPLQENTPLAADALLKTAENATVDLFLTDSGTVLRLMPNSTLRFDRLEEMPGAERPITTTRLALVAGALIGSQRKLPAPSQFEVKLATGVAKIVGTEYLVRADGAVTCLSGEVSVRYNLPGNGGSVKVEVPAGFSFDPASGKVVPTTAAYLQNIIADVQAVRDNAQVFKIGRATLVVNATEEEVTPTHPRHPPHPHHPPHPPHPPHPGQDDYQDDEIGNVHVH